MNTSILIADDDDGVLSALNLLLKSEGFDTCSVTQPEHVLKELKTRDFSLVLMDLNYSSDTTSGDEGIQLIQSIRAQDEDLPIVVMTGWGTIDVAVKAMKKGANDFIQKPWENDRLLAIVTNQIKLGEIQKTSQKLRRQHELIQESSEPHPITVSPAAKNVMDTLTKVANTQVNVLLTGENGTGKSMFARYLHDLSDRRSQPLVSVNMGAVTESLFESEMFGHIKGAFTDAKSTRIGRFELADKGTLFLDEIANTPYSQQGKLLRVLEERQFEKVGSEKTQHVDIRIITATNAHLPDSVSQGVFRKDLMFRINTVEICIPPLRKRPEDIMPLAVYFSRKTAQKYGQPELNISKQAEQALKGYSWPGNVRELSHVVERAQILCQSGEIQVADLSLDLKEIGSINSNLSEKSDKEKHLMTLSEIESEAIKVRLDEFNGNAQDAAKSLGVSRSAFYRKLEKINN